MQEAGGMGCEIAGQVCRGRGPPMESLGVHWGTSGLDLQSLRKQRGSERRSFTSTLLGEAHSGYGAESQPQGRERRQS